MNYEEILKKYKEEVNKKPDQYESIFNDWGTDFFYEKHIEIRDELHRNAIQYLNTILSPELKIFMKNLCANKLGYPDEVIFYKAFGDEPEIGTSVSKKELEEKGVDINEFEKMIDYWCFEGNFVEKQTIGENDYYYLDSLCERPDITSEVEAERLKASVALKLEVFNNNRIPQEKQEEYIEYIDTLLRGINPRVLEERKLKAMVQEIYDKPELFSSLSKEFQEYIKRMIN